MPGFKRHFASFLRISRTSIYIPSTKQNVRDEEALSGLLGANADNPAYGYRRLGLHLAWSVHKTSRLMALARIVAQGVKRQQPLRVPVKEPQIELAARSNLLKERQLIAMYVNHIWAEDFTHIWFQGQWYYVATIIDLYSRVIVGWALSAHHDTDLVVEALIDALGKHSPPAIVHQDQGSEYCSERYDIIALSQGVELSFSAKGHPWENGFQESFYRYFKIEIKAKKLDRFADVGQLHEAIAKQLYYYNHERIHSTLKMSPIAFSASGLPPRNMPISYKIYASKSVENPKPEQMKQTWLQQMVTGVRDRVFRKVGA